MNETLCDKVSQLEKNYDRTIFEKENYKKMAMLFYYGMKYEWVKQKIGQAHLPSYFKKDCTKEEIEDYISHIKSIENRKKMKDILNKLDNDLDKAFLLDLFIQNKKVS